MARFPSLNKGKGEGGWGGDGQRNRQVTAQALSKLPLSKLPFSFSPKFQNFFSQRESGGMATLAPVPRVFPEQKKDNILFYCFLCS